MKTFRAIGLVVSATALSAGMLLACSDSSSTTTSTDSGVDSTSPVRDGGGGDTGTTTPDAGVAADTGTGAAETGAVTTEAGTETGAPDGGSVNDSSTDGSALAIDGVAPDAAVPDCAAYCTAIQANCTGANAQYASTPECLTACALTPVGSVGQTAGDNRACRAYHAGLALTLPNPHCWHAGPYGFGACGSECESFCRLAVDYCSAAGGFDAGAPPYGSLTECTTACAGFAMVNGGDAGLGVEGGYTATTPSGGNTLDCREYHLGAALQSAALQQVHCKHPGAVSPTCQ